MHSGATNVLFLKTTTLSKTVWILSLVSLFADVASEMLYPVMPVYLQSIGFSVLLIGILEGVAEATAGLSKGYFGKLSDRKGVRLPFVRLGYLLAAISKPMMALFTVPAWIFGARTMDRLGKGIRTGARDALLSDEATPETKGAVFGFHRGMDTLGAVIGPAIALAYLYYAPGQYKPLFFIAFFPGIISVALLFILKEKKKEPQAGKNGTYNFFSFLSYWKESNADYKKLVAGLLLFTLFNSSDYFLLLKMKGSGLNDTHVIGVYIFYNVFYALFSYPLGALGDKIGLKTVLLSGLLLFAGVYFGMAFDHSFVVYLLLFLLYGVYAAATDGVSTAWISNMAERKDTGTAIGTFKAFQSICTMIASSLAGFIWYEYGALPVFISAAIVTVLVFFYLLIAFGNRKLKAA